MPQSSNHQQSRSTSSTALNKKRLSGGSRPVLLKKNTSLKSVTKKRDAVESSAKREMFPQFWYVVSEPINLRNGQLIPLHSPSCEKQIVVPDEYVLYCSERSVCPMSFILIRTIHNIQADAARTTLAPRVHRGHSRCVSALSHSLNIPSSRPSLPLHAANPSPYISVSNPTRHSALQRPGQPYQSRLPWRIALQLPISSIKRLSRLKMKRRRGQATESPTADP